MNKLTFFILLMPLLIEYGCNKLKCEESDAPEINFGLTAGVPL